MSGSLDQIKQREKNFHEDSRKGGPLPAVDLEQVRRCHLSPCWETGVDIYSDNKTAFHRFIQERGGWKDKYVLDYACGDALWATYFALTGARKVAGFDICEIGIARGSERLERQCLSDKVSLFVMDASSLDFSDNEFEIVSLRA